MNAVLDSCPCKQILINLLCTVQTEVVRVHEQFILYLAGADPESRKGGAKRGKKGMEKDDKFIRMGMKWG